MNYIKIKNENYPFRMGLNAFRKFGKLFKIELNEVIDFINSISETATKEGSIPFEMLEKLSALIICGIEDGIRKEGRPVSPHGLEVDDIIDLFEESPDEIENIFKSMTSEIPSENNQEGNQQAPEKKTS